MQKQHRILIVDDSREIVAALKSFFERKYETLTAYDGFNGLQLFEDYESKIDLVITDLLMPELDGFGLIAIIKKKYPGVPIIAITGWRGNVEQSDTKLDVDQVFEKPFKVYELDKSVSKLLANRRVQASYHEFAE
jgi:DNA-binding NtrC family response regulator